MTSPPTNLRPILPRRGLWIHRRRLRRTEGLRRMVRERMLTVDDLIYPMFVMDGIDQRQEVPSMPGCFRYSLDLLLDELQGDGGMGGWGDEGMRG